MLLHRINETLNYNEIITKTHTNSPCILTQTHRLSVQPNCSLYCNTATCCGPQQNHHKQTNKQTNTPALRTLQLLQQDLTNWRNVT